MKIREYFLFKHVDE